MVVSGYFWCRGSWTDKWFRSWAGFASVYVAVFVVVVGVTTRDRPAAAPPVGEYEFGYHAIAYPSFMVGMTATATIFVSSAGTSAFLPVISEMKVRLVKFLFVSLN